MHPCVLSSLFSHIGDDGNAEWEHDARASRHWHKAVVAEKEARPSTANAFMHYSVSQVPGILATECQRRQLRQQSRAREGDGT